MTKFIVTTVDISETSDNKGYVREVYSSKSDAQAYVKGDMERFIEDANGMELDIDWDKMSISTSDGQYGCEWNIEEINIPIEKPNLEKAEKVLVDNGIEEDEASTVLQAVGYALLDIELYPIELYPKD